MEGKVCTLQMPIGKRGLIWTGQAVINPHLRAGDASMADRHFAR
jgi:hypothetical protein